MADEVSGNSDGGAPAEGKPRIMLPRALRPKEEGGGAARAAGAKAARDRPFPWVFILAAVVMLGGGWWLVSAMSDNAKIEDCGMSGRKNCVPLDPKSGR